MKNIVTYTPPKFQPLPTYITSDRVNSVPLPVKVESARRAIALCEDLPEIERYRDQADGLAAAVKIMKHTTPEMVRSVNRMYKEAIDRMGHLLLQLDDTIDAEGAGNSRRKEEVRGAARKAGISDGTRRASMAFASTSDDVRKRVIEDDNVPPRASKMASAADPEWKEMLRRPGGPRTSEAVRLWNFITKVNHAGAAVGHLGTYRVQAKLFAKDGRVLRRRISYMIKALEELRDSIPQ